MSAPRGSTNVLHAHAAVDKCTLSLRLTPRARRPVLYERIRCSGHTVSIETEAERLIRTVAAPGLEGGHSGLISHNFERSLTTLNDLSQL
eukprot:3585833-Rhodomonas_salina.2